MASVILLMLHRRNRLIIIMIALVSWNSKSETTGSILPLFFLRYLRLCGLYHPRAYFSPATKLPSSWKTGYLVAILTALVPLLNVVDWVYYYIKDIATLDFFVLARLVNNMSQLLQGPFFLLVMFRSRRALFRLLERFAPKDSSSTAVGPSKRMKILY